MFISYLISGILFWIIFFKSYLYKKSYRQDPWKSDGKWKKPLWAWIIGILILLVPIANAILYLAAFLLCGFSTEYNSGNYYRIYFFDKFNPINFFNAKY